MFYFFVAAFEVTFHDKSGEGGVVRENTIIKVSTENIPLKMLAKAQESIVLGVLQKLQNPEIIISSATVLNISRLAFMTDEEFYTDMQQPGTDVPPVPPQEDTNVIPFAATDKDLNPYNT